MSKGLSCTNCGCVLNEDELVECDVCTLRFCESCCNGYDSMEFVNLCGECQEVMSND